MAVDLPTIYAAAATGALFSGIFTALTSWITKQSEERKHMREIAVKMATEHWKFVHERNPQSRPTMDTLTILMLNSMTLVSMAGAKFKTDTQIREYLEKGLRKADIALEVFDAHKIQPQKETKA